MRLGFLWAAPLLLLGCAATPDDGVPDVVRKMREAKIDLDFEEAPLPDVLAFLETSAGIDIVIDVDHGVPPGERKISIRMDGFPVDFALGGILAQAQLDWCVDDGVVVVTTPDGVRGWTPRRMPGDPERSQSVLDTMHSRSVDLDLVDVPLKDAIVFLRNATRLNILLDDSCIDGVDRIKITLRAREIPVDCAVDLTARLAGLGWYVVQGGAILAPKEAAKDYPRPVPKPLDSDAEWTASIAEKLKNTRMDLEFEDAPLDKVVDYIREHAGIEIEFDRKPLIDGSSVKKTTIRLKGALLEDVLKTLLEANGLALEQVDHLLLITRPVPPK